MSDTHFATASIDSLYSTYSSSEHGLKDEQQISQNRTRWGSNALSTQSNGWLTILLRQLTSPFLYLLVAAAAVSFVLSDGIDGIMIMVFVTINTIVGFYQEFKSEQTLHALKQYIAATCDVVRGGKAAEIAATELVCGDIVEIGPGDIIPADLRLIHATSLEVDESALTGESAAVLKTAEIPKQAPHQLLQATTLCFSSTTVVAGRATGIVCAVGNSTAIGQISHLSTTIESESSFEKSIARFSRFILYLIGATLILMLGVNILLKGVNHAGSLMLFSIALAVSVIPEGLPVVITFALSRGAGRLAKKKVVVKRLSAIEDLGSIDVLCTDKTGTLTQNILSYDGASDSKHEHELIAYARLCAPTHLNASAHSFDIALRAVHNHEVSAFIKTYEVIDLLPFDPQSRTSQGFVKQVGTQSVIIKGAAESVLARCKKSATATHTREWCERQEAEGRRTIIIAKKEVAASYKLQEDQIEHDFTCVGALSFVDPIKDGVADAIKQAARLGLTIKILTGDSRAVSAAVARTIGLIESDEQVITGDELDALPHNKVSSAIESHTVFARVTPQQKYLIIQSLQHHHTVGFMGEGINDAPALKAAHVGLVVKEATDVAREAADIILLQKSLHVIVDGIQEGRVIFTNISKYIKATLTSNFGNFYTLAIASLLVSYLPILPLQILLINLLTDSPMIAVATDTVESEEVLRPKTYDFKDTILLGTALGFISTVFDFLFFVAFASVSAASLQTNWFIGSVLTELVLLFSIRSHRFMLRATRPSTGLILLSILAALVGIITPFTSIGHTLFSFITPSISNIQTIATIAVGYLIATELGKYFFYKTIAPDRHK